MRVLLVLVVLGVIVFFFVGLVAPARSRRLQRRYDRVMRRAERSGDGSAGRLGDWTSRALAWTRRIGDRALRAGRALRRRVSA